MERPAWMICGASARGAAHYRSGAPNQDAIGWVSPNWGEMQASLVVSDGHGGRRHTHSHIGSRLAIEAALAECARLPAAAADNDGMQFLDRCHRRWLAAIADYAGHGPDSCMVVIAASFLVKLAGGSVILNSMAGFLVAALLQGGASVVTEAFLLMRASSRTGFLSLTMAGAIYAATGGLLLAVPWLLFEGGSGSSLPAVNVYALAGLLAGGSIAGGFAAIIFAPLLRRLSVSATVGRASRQ